MNQHILPGNPPLQIHLRRSSRARRMSLRVSRLDGKVTLTVPSFVGDSEALAFVHEKEQWLRTHHKTGPEPVVVGIGSMLPLGGKDHRIVAGQGRRIVVSDGVIAVPGNPTTAGRRLAAHLKQVARGQLASASDGYAQKLGRGFTKLTLRDTRSRWGSCSSAGGLMYSWRLILAPAEVLSYVAAHEVAHLQEMNHSADFWAVVRELYGPYEDQRRWLHEHGADLHRFRFGD